MYTRGTLGYLFYCLQVDTLRSNRSLETAQSICRSFKQVVLLIGCLTLRPVKVCFECLENEKNQLFYFHWLRGILFGSRHYNVLEWYDRSHLGYIFLLEQRNFVPVENLFHFIATVYVEKSLLLHVGIKSNHGLVLDLSSGTWMFRHNKSFYNLLCDRLLSNECNSEHATTYQGY